MEVFLSLPELLEGGQGDKKFIVFPAREMSADSLSCPPCKTSTDSALRITHYVSLCTQCVRMVHSGTVEWAGIRRKETKRLGVPPTLINIKSLRRLPNRTRDLSSSLRCDPCDSSESEQLQMHDHSGYNLQMSTSQNAKILQDPRPVFSF